MATDRRKFLALMALGVPGTATVIRQGPSTIPGRVLNLEESENERGPTRLDLVSGLKERLGDISFEDDVSIRVIRRAPSDCPPGRIRWAIAVEEADGSSRCIMDRHPRVLLVYGKSLRALYSLCLEQAGCRVESAPDNNSAVRLYREHGPYDLVVTHLFDFRELSKRIRERNPEQAIAIVGACCAMSVRMHHKIPVLREGFRQQQLVSLVESAIKPRARILVVAGDDWSGFWDFVVNYVSTFELEVESNGEDGLRRYRERGPYDIVLTGFREFVPTYLSRTKQTVGMVGSDLALSIHRENPQQRIAIITEERSPTVRRFIQRKLGDIPVLREEELFEAVQELRLAGQASEGEILLASVDRSIAKKQKRIRKTAKP